MDIRTALDRIIVIQDGLTISSPAAAEVRKAYKYVPAQAVALPDVPAFLNEWSLTGYERHEGLRITHYAVHSQLLVYDAQLDQAADIASALYKEYIDALDADVTLAQTVSVHHVRGGQPTLVSIDRAGQTYVGIDMYLDLVMHDSVIFA